MLFAEGPVLYIVQMYLKGTLNVLEIIFHEKLFQVQVLPNRLGNRGAYMVLTFCQYQKSAEVIQQAYDDRLEGPVAKICRLI